jgi:hypothetical protein
MDLKEIGWDFVDWIHVAQDSDEWRALLSTITGLGIPCWEFLKYVSDCELINKD